MKHSRGAPYHPMTQGKIERYHRSMKNVIKLEHYYFPWELENATAEWVAHYPQTDIERRGKCWVVAQLRLRIVPPMGKNSLTGLQQSTRLNQNHGLLGSFIRI